jgi:hypothetical protein
MAIEKQAPATGQPALAPDRSRLPLPGVPVAGVVALAVGGVAVVAAATVAGVAPLLIAAALAVPLLGVLCVRPQRGVLLLAALLPFDGMLLLLPSQSTLVRSWKEGVVLLTLAATAVCPARSRASQSRRYPPWLVPLVALVGYCVVSAVATSVHTGITGLRIDFFYVLVALAIWRCPLSTRDLDRLVTILMVDAWITSAYGLAQQVLGAARLARLGYPYDATIRFTGTHLRSFASFNQPFPFAYFLMMVILVCLPVAVDDLSRRRNRLFLTSLPAIGAALVFTFVRGALLGLAAGGAYLAWRRYRGLVFVVPLVVVAFLYLPQSLLSSVTASSSLGQRASGWAANLGHLVNHPLGEGVGTTGASAAAAAGLNQTSPNAPTVVLTPTPYQPDNYYYKELYELGVLGLWLFVMMLVSVAATGDRGARASPHAPSATLSFGITAFVVAALASSLVSTFFEIFPMDAYFWMFTGVVSVAWATAEHRATTPASADVLLAAPAS